MPRENILGKQIVESNKQKHFSHMSGKEYYFTLTLEGLEALKKLLELKRYDLSEDKLLSIHKDELQHLVRSGGILGDHPSCNIAEMLGPVCSGWAGDEIKIHPAALSYLISETKGRRR